MYLSAIASTCAFTSRTNCFACCSRPRLVLGLDQPGEVVQRELGVDGHERAVEADDGVDSLAAPEAVLELVLVTGEGIGEQVAQE